MLERHVSIVVEQHMNAFIGNLTKSLIDLIFQFGGFEHVQNLVENILSG